ncbi:MAG TPA: DDE-type integrase/transposase/recombinase [Flavobacterium sp.]
MKITMYSSPPKSLNQVEKFLQIENCKFEALDKKEAYRFIRKTTWNLKYNKLSKPQKGKILQYLTKSLGYSQIQIKRLVGKAVKGKLLDPKSTKNKTSFHKTFLTEDIKLLAEFDGLANYPNGYALIENFRRMYQEFNDLRFEKLAGISNGHIYNLRKTNTYKRVSLKFEHTKPISENMIGIREKPDPQGRPGYIRVDSVHGGEKDGEKGVYYINLVDEVTQFEIVVCVQRISERFLTEVWSEILVSFPFRIVNFHSDNGSEFINKIVADILNRLHIKQTKSRPRHSNDNGLVESKNGWIIRKHFGYIYAHEECAPTINNFLNQYFNSFLNYHRPCAFSTEVHQANGKIKVIYKREDYKIPYAKLKEIDPKGEYLRQGQTYAKLDKIAKEYSDYEYLKMMKEEHLKMLRKIRLKTNQKLLTENLTA